MYQSSPRRFSFRLSSRLLSSCAMVWMLTACTGDVAEKPKSQTISHSKGAMGQSGEDGLTIDQEKMGASLEQNNLSPFLAGVLARNKLSHDESAHYFAEALEQDPGSIFLKQNAFAGYFNAGNYKRAALLAPTLASQSDNELLHMISISDAIMKGDGQLALDRGKDAPQKGYSFIIYPILKAWAAAQKGDAVQAYATLDEMQKISSLKLIAVEYAAYIAHYLNDLKRADAYYQQLVNDKTSKSVQAILAYAVFLTQQDRQDDFKVLVLGNKSRFPNNRFLSNLSLMTQEARKGAPAYLKPAGSIGNLYELLARDLSRYKDKRMALAFYNLAMFVKGPNTDIVMQQARLLSELKEYNAAVEKYRLIPAKSRYGVMAFMGQVRGLFDAGRDDEALKLLNDELLKNPKNLAVLNQLADYHRSHSNFEQALEFYNRLLAERLKPVESDWYFYFARGISLEQLDRWEQAEADFLFALKLSPEQPDVLNYLGYSWVDRKINMIKAQELIEKAAKLSPDNGYITDSLGWVYYLTGDYKRAVETLEKAVLIEAGDSTLHDHLGDAYWMVGRKIEARFQWRHALNGDADEDLKVLLRQKIKTGLKKP